MAKHDYGNHPAVQAMKAHVPPILTPGKPVAVQKRLYGQMAWHDAFYAVHHMTPGEARQRGLVEITSDAPAQPGPQSGQA